MDTGAWIATAAALFTIATVFNGYRATRVTMFQNRVTILESEIKDLREQNRQCKAEVTQLRDAQDYLFQRLALHDGARISRRPQSDTPFSPGEER